MDKRGNSSVFTNLLSPINSILCLGAHADDIEIGCGGTLLRLAQENLDLKVTWIVFSAADERQNEAANAVSKILSKQQISRLEIYSFDDGCFPENSTEIRSKFRELSIGVSADLIFTHRLEDRHQDHRLLSEFTWNCFRNHLIMEYEIPKYEGDLGQPNVYITLNQHYVEKKIQIITESFATQKTKQWFSEDTFRSLMRIRGLESNSYSGYSEAFHCRKLVI